MKKSNLKKLTVTAILAAVAVVGSLFSFPVFGSKCAPVQHMVNILCAVTVGPWWALAQAFIASLIRNLLGLGSPLAFPGSMCGALLGGLLYKYGKKLPFAYIGEVVGTGILGGMLSCDGKYSSNIVYVCSAIPHQYLWRNDHCDHYHAAVKKIRYARKNEGQSGRVDESFSAHSLISYKGRERCKVRKPVGIYVPAGFLCM